MEIQVERDWLDVPRPEGTFFVNRHRVNIDHLSRAYKRPGCIILCDGSPHDAVMFIPPELTHEHYGFIAGMISENP